MYLGEVDPSVCVYCGAHPRRCRCSDNPMHGLLGVPEPEVLLWRIARTWQEQQTEAERMFRDALNQYAARRVREAAEDLLADPYERRALFERADEIDRGKR